MVSLICRRINGCVNNGEAGDLRRNRSHYDVTVMVCNDGRMFDDETPRCSHAPCGHAPWWVTADTQMVSDHMATHAFIAKLLLSWSPITMTSWWARERLTIVYSTIYSGADQSKHQSSASLAFVWGIHRGPVNSPHKWPVTRKMFPFDDVIMPSLEMTSWLWNLRLCWWPHNAY